MDSCSTRQESVEEIPAGTEKLSESSARKKKEKEELLKLGRSPQKSKDDKTDYQKLVSAL